MTKQRYKVELEQDLWHRTRARSIERGVTAGVIVEEALASYLDPAKARKVPDEPKSEPKALPVPTPLPAPLPELDAEMSAQEPSFGASRAVPKPVRAEAPKKGFQTRSRI